MDIGGCRGGLAIATLPYNPEFIKKISGPQTSRFLSLTRADYH